MSVGTPIGFHLVVRLADDRVLAPDGARRRALARLVLRHGEARGLLAFGAADTHLHLLATCSREAAGALAHAVDLGLRALVAGTVGCEHARIRPVSSHAHLVNTFRYVQTNAARHGITDPGASEASSLHDLLGLRLGADWLIAGVHRHLPRVGRTELTELLGVPGLPTRSDVPFAADHVDAAAAVLGRADLSGITPAARRGRRAVAHVGLASARTDHVAAVLGITERAVRRLAHVGPEPRVLDALHRQLAWRERARPGTTPDAERYA